MYLLFSKVCTIEVGDDVSSIQSIPKKQQHKSTFPFFCVVPLLLLSGEHFLGKRNYVTTGTYFSWKMQWRS